MPARFVASDGRRGRNQDRRNAETVLTFGFGDLDFNRFPGLKIVSDDALGAIRATNHDMIARRCNRQRPAKQGEGEQCQQPDEVIQAHMSDMTTAAETVNPSGRRIKAM